MGSVGGFMRAGYNTREFDTHQKHRLLATPHKSPVRSTAAAAGGGGGGGGDASTSTSATRRAARLSGALHVIIDDDGNLFAHAADGVNDVDSDSDALTIELPRMPAASSKRESFDRIDEDPTPPVAPQTPLMRASASALTHTQLTIAAAEAALFSPYKPPTIALTSANTTTTDNSDALSNSDHSASGEPAAKRRPASCMIRASTTLGQLVSASGEVFLRSEPTDALHHYALPHEIECGLVLITPSTLCDVLRGRYAHRFDHVLVLDCRFEYEFAGGHVKVRAGRVRMRTCACVAHPSLTHTHRAPSQSRPSMSCSICCNDARSSAASARASCSTVSSRRSAARRCTRSCATGTDVSTSTATHNWCVR
jgi:hypothetical protein